MTTRAVALFALLLPAALGAQDRPTLSSPKKRNDVSQLLDAMRGDATGASSLRGSTSATPRALTLGTTETAVLDAGDPALDDGVRYEAWVVSAYLGQTIVVSMQSGDFDAALAVATEDGEVLMINDDLVFGERDASATFVAREPGNYYILASTADGNLGSYRLEARQARRGGNAIAYGQAYLGELTENDRVDDQGYIFDRFEFDGTAGTEVAISMRAYGDNEALDAVLTLLGPNGEVIGSNDDGPWGDLDSFLEITLPRTARFTIVLRSYGGGADGAYKVALTREN